MIPFIPAAIGGMIAPRPPVDVAAFMLRSPALAGSGSETTTPVIIAGTRNRQVGAEFGRNATAIITTPADTEAARPLRKCRESQAFAGRRWGCRPAEKKELDHDRSNSGGRRRSYFPRSALPYSSRWSNFRCQVVYMNPVTPGTPFAAASQERKLPMSPS